MPERASIQDVKNGHWLYLFCGRLCSFCNHWKAKCILFCFPFSKYWLHIQRELQSNSHLEAGKCTVYGSWSWWAQYSQSICKLIDCTVVIRVMFTLKRKENTVGKRDLDTFISVILILVGVHRTEKYRYPNQPDGSDIRKRIAYNVGNQTVRENSVIISK